MNQALCQLSYLGRKVETKKPPGWVLPAGGFLACKFLPGHRPAGPPIPIPGSHQQRVGHAGMPFIPLISS
jgi:hypothetical protein